MAIILEEEHAIKRNNNEDDMVEVAFKRLLSAYMSSQHRKKSDLITKAFNFARQAHKGVKRLSGEPYIMHPLAVAQIACQEIGLGSTSICSALLHDVVEDTDYTVEDIENIFGAKVAQIVGGLTKISGGIFSDQTSIQAENFKKLLLTMSEDIRVILIKICDRLHNMRTLDSQPDNKKYKIAGETLYIYAPLANRLGLNKIKSELEDLSFKYEHPDQYALIQAKLASTEAGRQAIFNLFIKPIEEALNTLGYQYSIKKRIKTPYSIWHKMQTKQISFEEIYDILAVRIVFIPQNRNEETNECFNIYVALNKIYRSHPDRLRDWINHPKANGYQALHVTLMSKQGQWIEVQIRSDRMDDIAEQGLAAHWKYKENNNEQEAPEDKELNDWIHTIKEILDDPQPNAMDFLDAIKLNLFASEIFVFTPKGEIKTMPTGCTVLDFAFSIHTLLGSRCIGAKVNHKLVPLSHRLQSGDQVEILTSEAQHVDPSWINFVSTAKAKSKIESILRKDRRIIQRKGEEIVTTFLENHNITSNIAIVDKLTFLHNIKQRDIFYQAVGENTIELGEQDLDFLQNTQNNTRKKRGWRRYVPFIKAKKENKIIQKEDSQPLIIPENFDKKKTVYITNENIKQFKFTSCCNPIPGDNILGFIDSHREVEIHRRSCPVANRLKSSYGNNILDTKWDIQGNLFFSATIKLDGIDRMGILNEITQVLSNKMNINIHRINLTCEEGIFSGEIELRVHNRNDVSDIIKRLGSIEDLQNITQVL